MTARERDVAALVAQGPSNREIAEKLVISGPPERAAWSANLIHYPCADAAGHGRHETPNLTRSVYVAGIRRTA